MFRGVSWEETHSILHPGAAGRSLALRGSLGYLSMNKYLMTGPKGNNESFVFSRPLMFVRRGGSRGRGSKTHCLPRDQSLSVLFIPPNTKTRKKNCEENSFALLRLAPANLPRFQRARPDHVRVESSCCCFPRELVSVRHRELVGSSTRVFETRTATGREHFAC